MLILSSGADQFILLIGDIIITQMISLQIKLESQKELLGENRHDFEPLRTTRGSSSDESAQTILIDLFTHLS